MNLHFDSDKLKCELGLLRGIISELEHWKRNRENKYLETATLTNTLVMLREYRKLLTLLLKLEDGDCAHGIPIRTCEVCDQSWQNAGRHGT
jgi:hypothetical protein